MGLLSLVFGFLSTPSARRATLAVGAAALAKLDFYPRPPRGGRRPSLRATTCHTYFYPRPPRGGRQRPCGKRGKPLRFLSTPSARRATSLPSTTRKSSANFYPRPPRGGRPHTAVGWHNAKLFLSTPSARRATFKRRQDVKLTIFLSTPSARRATM